MTKRPSWTIAKHRCTRVTPGITLILAMLLAPLVAQAKDRDGIARGWQVLLDACLSYAQTGRINVFDKWYAAAPLGGVCNGDPSCDLPIRQYIIADPKSGSGIINARVPATRDETRDFPLCWTPFELRTSRDFVLSAQSAFLDRAVLNGRLSPLGAAPNGDLRYRICAFDGRVARLVFNEIPHAQAFGLFLPAQAAPCDPQKVS